MGNFNYYILCSNILECSGSVDILSHFLYRFGRMIQKLTDLCKSRKEMKLCIVLIIIGFMNYSKVREGNRPRKASNYAR